MMFNFDAMTDAEANEMLDIMMEEYDKREVLRMFNEKLGDILLDVNYIKEKKRKKYLNIFYSLKSKSIRIYHSDWIDTVFGEYNQAFYISNEEEFKALIYAYENSMTACNGFKFKGADWYLVKIDEVRNHDSGEYEIFIADMEKLGYINDKHQSFVNILNSQSIK